MAVIAAGVNSLRLLKSFLIEYLSLSLQILTRN